MRRTFSSVVLCCTLALTACVSASDSSDPGTSWASEWLDLPGTAHSPVRVGIIDGGLVHHSALADTIVAEWEAAPLADTPRNAHANTMAGLVLGVTGRDPASVIENIELLDVRVLDEQGRGQLSDVAAGILWAIEHDAAILLLSLSVSTDDSELRAAVDLAVNSGALVIASTANGFSESPSYPAEYPGVVGVTSVNRELFLAPLAGTRGADVAAPGDHVSALTKGGGFDSASGTSVAAAVAASVLATCARTSSLDEAGAIEYAEASGVRATPDQRSIPVLRCLPKER